MNREIDYEFLIHQHNCVGRSENGGCRMPCNKCIKLDFLAAGLGEVEKVAGEILNRVFLLVTDISNKDPELLPDESAYEDSSFINTLNHIGAKYGVVIDEDYTPKKAAECWEIMQKEIAGEKDKK